MTSLHDRHIKPLILAGLNGDNWRLKDYESRGGYQQLRRLINDKVAPDAIINGAGAPRLPGISNITFPGTQADFLLLLMDGKSISCSTGAACTAGVHRPSHVLMAMGHDEIGATSSLRFSLGATTTQSDIEYALSVIPEVVAMAKAANSL